MSPKKPMVDHQHAEELNTLIANVLLSNFPFFHGRTHTSKPCNIVEAFLSKQQVIPEALYPPQAGRLLQILLIYYHSMKMRYEWLNMALWCSHVGVYLCRVLTSSKLFIQFWCAGEV